MIYVGSAESEEFDQVLDTIYVGPIPEGRHMFVFQVKRHSQLYYYNCFALQLDDFNIFQSIVFYLFRLIHRMSVGFQSTMLWA